MEHAVAIAVAATVALAVGADDLLAQSRLPAPQLLGQPYLFRVAPPALYADSTLTPGKADTFSAAAIQKRYKCPKGVKAGKKRTCTYSQTHRGVSTALKNAVYAAYEQLYPGLTAYCHAVDVRPAKRRAFTIGKGQRCEVDHFCPVGIGCSNDPENLWIQRADTTYNGQPMGFHQKDDLEARGIAQIKAGTLTPEEFDRRIWGDWVSYYLEVRPQHSNVSN
jgi:hypothetical protein